MRLRVAAKIAIVVVLSLLMLIPLGMIQGLIGERQALRDGVIREIARESVDGQQVAGPIIVVPYKQRVVDVVTEEKDGKTTSTRRERMLEGRLALMPEQLRIAGELVPEARYRGIYKAILYNAVLTVNGHFVVPRDLGIDAAKVGDYEFGAASLVFGISDPRGIVGGGLTVDWGGAPIEFAPGADAPGFRGGASAALGRLDPSGGGVEFRFAVRLKGLSRIDFVPTGKDSTVTLKSPWPHPSFYGRYLPQSEIGDTGFVAQWRTSLLSTNVRQIYDRCLAASRECGELGRLAHGVALYQPVDVYQQLERTAKYGFLFVGLSFLGFFLYEVLKRLQIHPVQYGLVGAALATFYLLMTSLSEHIGFALAYAVASAACVALIGAYVGYVLQSQRRGLGFTAMLAALYGLLFVLVRAADNALLMGSIALFAVLVIVIIGTRKVNWYAIDALAARRGGRDASPAPAPEMGGA
jgi:inner membrane protein